MASQTKAWDQMVLRNCQIWRVGRDFYKSVGVALYVKSQKINPFGPNLLPSNGVALQGYSDQTGLLAQTSREQEK